jgi:hypothetical protein
VERARSPQAAGARAKGEAGASRAEADVIERRRVSQAEPQPRRTPTASIRKRVFLLAAALLLVLAVLSIRQRYLQPSPEGPSLEQVLSELDDSDPGWRLEALEEARPTVPDERNSAPVVLAAHGMMPKGAFEVPNIERFDRVPAPDLLHEATAVLLAKELAPVEPALLLARQLADMPAGRHRLVYDPNPFATHLSEQQKTRVVVHALRYDALRLAQKGDVRQALRSCKAMLHAARSIDDEPLLLSQLIRRACVLPAASAIERTLALGVPPLDDLARVQELVAEEEAHPSLILGLRGERATLHVYLTGLADGSISPATLHVLDGTTADMSLRIRFMGGTIRNMARRDHPRILQWMNRAIANARLPAHEQRAAEQALLDEIAALPRSMELAAVLLRLRNPVTELFRQKHALLRSLTVLLALERHRQEKGAWPGKLEELAPKHLSAVPLDPYDGKPLRYRRLADGVIVYSIGRDGKDDGGKLNNDSPFDPGFDLGYRLWNVEQRRAPRAK